VRRRRNGKLMLGSKYSGNVGLSASVDAGDETPAPTLNLFMMEYTLTAIENERKLFWSVYATGFWDEKE